MGLAFGVVRPYKLSYIILNLPLCAKMYYVTFNHAICVVILFTLGLHVACTSLLELMLYFYSMRLNIKLMVSYLNVLRNAVRQK